MSGPTSLPSSPVPPQPWLLEITRKRWNYGLSFVADATTAIVPLTWSALTMQHHPGTVVPVVVCALLFYTLFEYLMHRFVFHGSRSPHFVRAGHAAHHRAPEGRVAQPFFMSILLGVVLLGLADTLLGSSRGALFTGVSALAYLAYGGLHHLVHTPAVQYRPVLWLRAAHEIHHARPGRNFGVTTPLWDFVFGTWSSPSRG